MAGLGPGMTNGNADGGTARMPIEVVVFDVGDTLADETRYRAGWAEVLGVGTPELMAAIKRAIEDDQEIGRIFRELKPDFDLKAGRELMHHRFGGAAFAAQDLFPDVRPCLARLKAQGFRLGVAGNQPAASEPLLRSLGLPFDFIASSAVWGVRKPAPEFFARVIDAAGAAPERIAYVGDRVDNDVLPALAAGLVSIFLRRGPWAEVQRHRPEAGRAQIAIDGLADLPEALAASLDGEA